MKKAVSLLLALIMLSFVCLPAHAAGNEALRAANGLHDLGLFQGKATDQTGRPVYALDDRPTRNEAVIMLVRLLGKEEEALSGTWNTPFTDVAYWARPYVGYAYANELTNGTGATSFSGDSLITAAQYLTFVLRALGYDSGKDFKWDEAWVLSDTLGITDHEYGPVNNKSFIRGDVAKVSIAVLQADLKNREITLAQKLIREGVFSFDQYITVISSGAAVSASEAVSPDDLTRGGYVILTKDIAVTGDLTLTRNTVLDLNGHSLTGRLSLITVVMNSESSEFEDSTKLIVAPGASVSLRNGYLKNLSIENNGTIPSIYRLETIGDQPATHMNPVQLDNHGKIGTVSYSVFDLYPIWNYSDIDLIDNCDISGYAWSAVTNSNIVSEYDADGIINLNRINHCRLVCMDKRGKAFSGGDVRHAKTLIEDSVLIGGGRGGMESYSDKVTAVNCNIINTNTVVDTISTTCAVWFPIGEDVSGFKPPHLDGCTLIAMKYPCAESHVKDGQSIYTEISDMSSCSFLPLSTVSDLNKYTAWTMDSLPDN